MIMDAQINLKETLAQRFKELPSPVQQAITSSDVEKRLRELATQHRLHVDQWDGLENEVMLALLGFEHPQDLEKNLAAVLGSDGESIKNIAQDINRIVFEPIREELERQLEHPEAQEKRLTGAEAAREQILGGNEANAAPMPTTPPAPTPPAPKAEATVVRAPASGAYKPGEASTARKSVTDDPYRELPQ